MAYITIDTNNKQAVLFLEYVKTLPFVKVYQEPDKDTLEAMDAKNGKTKKSKNAKDFISLLAKKENNTESAYSWENALKFFKSHQVSFKDYKFNREEANVR